MDNAISIDQVSNPIDTFVFAASHFLWAPSAVGFEHGMIFIAQHGILKCILLDKFALPGGRIGADAHDLYTCIRKYLEFITESRTFLDSARGRCFWKKP